MEAVGSLPPLEQIVVTSIATGLRKIIEYPSDAFVAACQTKAEFKDAASVSESTAETRTLRAAM
jgi:hypothetical protein